MHYSLHDPLPSCPWRRCEASDTGEDYDERSELAGEVGGGDARGRDDLPTGPAERLGRLRRGENHDDERSGRVDRLGDCNSGLGDDLHRRADVADRCGEHGEQPPPPPADTPPAPAPPGPTVPPTPPEPPLPPGSTEPPPLPLPPTPPTSPLELPALPEPPAPSEVAVSAPVVPPALVEGFGSDRRGATSPPSSATSSAALAPIPSVPLTAAPAQAPEPSADGPTDNSSIGPSSRADETRNPERPLPFGSSNASAGAGTLFFDPFPSPEAIVDSLPEIAVSFHPGVLGSRLETFAMLLDGSDVSASVSLDAAAGRALLHASTLDDGLHRVLVRMQDGFGSTGSYTWTFTRVEQCRQVSLSPRPGIRGRASPREPSPPVGLSAKPGNASVRLSWSPPPRADGVAAHRVLRRRTAGEAFIVIAEVPGEIASFLDTRLPNCVAQRYALLAVTSTGEESAPSAEVSARPEGPPPIAPAGLTAAFQGGVVRLAWKPNPEPTVKEYLLYRLRSPGSPGILLATIPRATTHYVDGPGFDGGSPAPWYYALRARDRCERLSALSEPVRPGPGGS
ncbi:MAG: fibronectin type III domain-containing protein [Planctomycetes bacterium]|nr:fibronectin type III domain-containing protein [Planctomycetota bacterium]